jgi:hypothetical protein
VRGETKRGSARGRGEARFVELHPGEALLLHVLVELHEDLAHPGVHVLVAGTRERRHDVRCRACCDRSLRAPRRAGTRRASSGTNAREAAGRRVALVALERRGQLAHVHEAEPFFLGQRALSAVVALLAEREAQPCRRARRAPARR